MTPIFDINELIALMRAGTSEEAIPHLEHITQKLPTHVAAHALLAQAYTNERRLEEARVAWQNALFLMPNSPSIKKGFRRVLKELSKQEPPQPVTEVEPPPELQENKIAETQEELLPETLEEPALEAQEEDLTETDGRDSEDEDKEQQETFYIPNTNRADIEEANDGGEEESETPEAPDEDEVETLETEREELEAETEDALVTDEENEDIIKGTLDIDLEELLDGAPSHSHETPSMLVNPSSHHNATPIEIEAIKAQTPQEEAEEEKDEEEDEPEEPIKTNDIPLPIITVPIPSSSSSNTPPPVSKGLPPDIPVPPILAPLVENTDEWAEDQELDNLIQELESARIVPKPDHEHIEVPALEDDIEDMVSETLARIFEGQKQYAKAADMYEKLAVLHPERARKFEAKASELRALKNNKPD